MTLPGLKTDRQEEQNEMNCPEFWKTSNEDVKQLYEGARRAEKSILTYSAGGRPVYLFAYGRSNEHEPKKANWSSALGSKDPTCYSDPATKTPTLVLIGAEHGQETEGTAALLNLVSLLETGKDLGGIANDALSDLCENIRLVIVPIANPDGRSRVKPAAILGLKQYDLRYWGQGTWKDGSLCGWPECKKIHPILDAVDFLGGYYNDDGINLMHDDFFDPKAKETKALLDLCERECADIVIHLHGGGDSKGNLMQTSYMSEPAKAIVEKLAGCCYERGKAENLEFVGPHACSLDDGPVPGAFNLASATHHKCGAVSFVYESNECIVDEPGPKLSHEQVTRMHMIVFEETLKVLHKREYRYI